MEKPQERRSLGRGLSALMADISVESPSHGQAMEENGTQIQVSLIHPNPNQPRRVFDEEPLQELAASIREKGVIQPVLLRKRSDGAYEIVAGERRWRAAQICKLHTIPAIVRDLSDSEMLEISIIENVQRENLNAIDEALAYRQLIDRFGHTQEKIAEGLAKSRSHIANLLRLLSLPDNIQELVRNGKLSAGHARTLISAPNAESIAQQIVEKGLSVREAEALSRNNAEKSNRAPRSIEKDADTRAIEADLSAGLKMSVEIIHAQAGEGGLLQVRYKTLDELDLLCRALSVGDRSL